MHRRKVDFLLNRDDMEVLILGSLGFSTAFIETRTKLSSGQILYRLKHGGVKRSDYRNGFGLGPKRTLEKLHDTSKQMLLTKIKMSGKKSAS